VGPQGRGFGATSVKEMAHRKKQAEFIEMNKDDQHAIDYLLERSYAKVLREVEVLDTGVHLSVCHGDITHEETDALICPANSFL